LARCEICGQISIDLRPIRLDGTLMEACVKCVKYGEQERIQKPSSHYQPRKKTSEKASTPRKPYSRRNQFELISKFGDKIRNLRESKGWTREELAKKLQVKESYLAKLELEKIHPNDKITKKIEKMLDIKLLTLLEDTETASSKKISSKMTLGDVVRVIGEKSE